MIEYVSMVKQLISTHYPMGSVFTTVKVALTYSGFVCHFGDHNKNALSPLKTPDE